MIEARYKMDRAAFIGAYKRWFEDRYPLRLLWWLSGFALVVGILNCALGDAFLGLFLTGTLGIYHLTLLLLREFAWFQIKSRRDIDETVAIQFSDENVLILTRHASSHLSWDWFLRVTLRDEGILLYQTQMTFYWVPRQAFQSENHFTQACELTRKRIHKVKDKRAHANGPSLTA